MASKPSPSSSPDPLVATVASMPPTLELLAFYRRRVEDFEAERAEFLKRFKAVEETGDEIHRLRSELHVREQEVAELQKALSDANVFLYDEREQVLRLQAEADGLKIQEIEDRRRIQHLLALTQPVAQEVTFFRDCRPEKMTRFPAASETLLSTSSHTLGGSASTTMNTSGAGSGARRSDGATTAGAGAGAGGDAHAQNRVLRTVYLPSERADALLLTTQSLQQQLADYRRLSDERTEAWRADRQAREEAHSRREAVHAAQVAALEKDLEKAKAKLKGVTEDYLTLRHESQAAHRHVRETAAALQASNAKLTQELASTRVMSEQEVEHVKLASKREGLHFKEYTRQQAQQREDDLRLLKEQYAEVQNLYEARMKAVLAKHEKLKQRYDALSRRRNLELEGFNTDISQLRRCVSQCEASFALLTDAGLSTSVSLSPPTHSSARTSRLVNTSRSNQKSSSRSSSRPSTSAYPSLEAGVGGGVAAWRVKSSGYGLDAGSSAGARTHTRSSSSSRGTRRRSAAVPQGGGGARDRSFGRKEANATWDLERQSLNSSDSESDPPASPSTPTRATAHAHAHLHTHSRTRSRTPAHAHAHPHASASESVGERLRTDLERAVADVTALKARVQAAATQG